LAADDMLAGKVGLGQSPPTLRLYTYQPCALVGRFQAVQNELHLEACAQQNLAVNRRPTGGGAIVMGPEQLGIALVIPGDSEDAYSRARERMARFSEGLVEGLRPFGIEGRFRGKNDIEVDGRKIAGLGIYRHASGGLLFHASLLVGLNIGQMLQTLNTPFEKISDKAIASVQARTATVWGLATEQNRTLSFEEVRQSVATGFAKVFGATLEPSQWTPEEQTATEELAQQKYRTEDWVFQKVEVPDAFGGAKRKTPAGLLDVRVTLAGQMIKAVLLGGDFFAEEEAVAQLEGLLRWHSANPKKVQATLEQGFAAHKAGLGQLPLAQVVETVLEAIANAQVTGAKAQLNQYGCFVNPQG